MEPSAVIFDVGNVLYHWDPRYLYEKLIDDPAELERIVDIVMSDKWHWQFDAGWKFSDIEPALIAEFPEDEPYIRAWGARFHESIGPQIEGMGRIVGDLAARDVPIFGITNFPAEFWPPFYEREAELFAPFRDIIVSGVEGIAKPDPAIYELAYKRFGIGDGEAIFIDDSKPNVLAAEANGIIGHHFQDSNILRAALEGYRLL